MTKTRRLLVDLLFEAFWRGKGLVIEKIPDKFIRLDEKVIKYCVGAYEKDLADYDSFVIHNCGGFSFRDKKLNPTQKVYCWSDPRNLSLYVTAFPSKRIKVGTGIIVAERGVHLWLNLAAPVRVVRT